MIVNGTRVDEIALRGVTRVLRATGLAGALLWSLAGQPASDAAETKSASTPAASGQHADELPVVSCRAWVIAERDSGEILQGHHQDEPLDNASTTKLMTAWLVSRLAGEDPGVLDEEIVFSQRADDTIGSSAGIGVGQRVRVGELLYGLLLPSGNDAAVAIAEHLGQRLHPLDARDGPPTDETGANRTAGNGQAAELDATASCQAFVAAMNAEAKRLGLAQTSFRNPHGLTAAGHHASAVDLVQLARLVLNDPLLAKIVATREYRSELIGADGQPRPVRWRNTNRLLGIDGYNGVKTGTTSAAGACLVASGERDGRGLIVVVLGSSGSEARYADSRNLFRWAWKRTGD